MRTQKGNKSVAKKYGFFHSIRFKLGVSYVIMVLFIILSGWKTEHMGEQAIEEKYKDTVAQSLNMLGKYIEFGFENVQGTAVEYLMDRDIGDYVGGKMSLDPSSESRYRSALEKELSTKIAADAFISDIYFLTDGIYAATTKSRDIKTLFSSYMDTEQGQRIMNDENQFFWLGQASIVDEELEVDSEQYAVRLVKYFNQKNAVMMIDIDSAKIMEILSGIDLGEGSRIAYITNDGVELNQDGTREEYFTSMDFYAKINASEGNSGIIENVVLDGQGYLCFYEKLPGTEGIICAAVPNNAVYEEIYAIRNVTAAVVIVACIVALVIGGGITISLTRSIQYFTQKVEMAAEGKINTSLCMKTKDEFASLTQHMNRMLESVMRFLVQAKNMSAEVASTVGMVTDTAQDITESANCISDEIAEIETGLTRQAEDARQNVNELESLAGQIGIVESDTREIADTTKNVIRVNVEKMDVLKDRTEMANEITKDVKGSIQKLCEKIENIRGIVEAMNEISDETSLLSLNASIEAARAGEAGKGFAVVADSIRNLAEQSASSANDIRKIAEMILDETLEVARVAGQAEQAMEEQKQSVSDTQDSFETMEKEVVKLLERVNFIILSIAEMQQDKEKSMEKMQSISAVTEEVVASVSTVNIRTGHQVETVANLEQLSEKMQNQVILLNEVMDYFSMESDETAESESVNG